MKTKKLTDGTYYWVRRPIYGIRTRDGYENHPDWEPMLWDAKADRFFTRGEDRGWLAKDLARIGDRIVRRPKRTARKVWVPLLFDGRTNALRAAVSHSTPSRSVAITTSGNTAIRAELSWDAAELQELTVAARKRNRRILDS